jgi:transcriptional regulator with GAF, ATPase, and Fis domain
MEEKITIYFPDTFRSRQVEDEIRRALAATGIEFSLDRGHPGRIAAVLWEERYSSGQEGRANVHQQIRELTLSDYKVIVINLDRNLSDPEKWQLLMAGAADIIDWQKKELFPILMKARAKRWRIIDQLMNLDEVKKKMIGDCLEWKRFLRKIVEVAYFTSCNILLTGASGTGKELTTNLIHAIDQRKEKGKLVLVDCTTISPELGGSEFYGHEKGAFTHAFQTRDGAFALADKGTIFLDELGELPLPLQAGLLRVIQEGSYKRLGSNLWQQTKFRLICATNRDLKEEIREGNFREDLYFRVAGAVFRLPLLEERKEDIPELVRHFLRTELQVIIAPEVDPTVMNYLITRHYPGNIRELKQLVSRIAMRYTEGDLITIGDMPEEELTGLDVWEKGYGDQRHRLEESIRLAIASGKDLAGIKNEIANLAIDIALQECGGSLKLAASKLNVEVRTLQYIRKRNGLSV